MSRARFEHIRTEIIQCLALVEALIDFGDGEDIEEGVFEQGKLPRPCFNIAFLLRCDANSERKGPEIAQDHPRPFV